MNVITQLKTPNDLEQLLKANTGLVLIKLGATWCGPCKKIDPLIMQWYEKFNHEKITRIVRAKNRKTHVFLTLQVI